MKKKNKVILSICIPVYNRIKLFKKLLSSINTQHPDLIEIIVIDDGSTENIKSILDDNGPEEFLVSFGYTGWSKGQLEKEILKGSWLITPADKDIIFNTPAIEKINKTSKLAGFDLTTVSSQYGTS